MVGLESGRPGAWSSWSLVGLEPGEPGVWSAWSLDTLPPAHLERHAMSLPPRCIVRCERGSAWRVPRGQLFTGAGASRWSHAGASPAVVRLVYRNYYRYGG